ncbi:MAG: hypothetical protein M0042_13390 [Nitrospiraceae bacterium]|nr:hypothetical protein [Nitrospiraceae bacterium]
MKKKKEKKQADMPEIDFKEFTNEESRIYEEAVKAFREAVASGKKLKEAYESYTIADDELRSIIQADFLKILIAERHFAGQQPLAELAASLGVSPDLVRDTKKRMLQEVGITAANEFADTMRPIHSDELKPND